MELSLNSTVAPVSQAKCSSYLVASPYTSYTTIGDDGLTRGNTYLLKIKRIALDGIERNYITCMPGQKVTVDINWQLWLEDASKKQYFIPVACTDGGYVDATLTYAKSIPTSSRDLTGDDDYVVLAAFDPKELATLRFNHATSAIGSYMSRVTLTIPGDTPSSVYSAHLSLANKIIDVVEEGQTYKEVSLFGIVLNTIDASDEVDGKDCLLARSFTIEVVKPTSKL